MGPWLAPGSSDGACDMQLGKGLGSHGFCGGRVTLYQAACQCYAGERK